MLLFENAAVRATSSAKPALERWPGAGQRPALVLASVRRVGKTESGETLRLRCRLSVRPLLLLLALVWVVCPGEARLRPAVRTAVTAKGASLDVAAAQQPAQPQIIVEDIKFQGNRRIPRETLQARLFTKRGDIYDPAALQRDFMALWNTGFFEDLRLEEENGPKGKILTFIVREKPTIRTIDYKGVKSVTTSEILDRFKERKVGLTVESPYDPTKVRHAEVVLQEFLAEKGRQFATVKAEPKRVPPNSVQLVFVVDEGPKVKVGRIDFKGNTVLNDRALRSAMKHTKPIGIPKSIVLENLFSRTFDQTKLGVDLELVRGKYQDRGYFKALVLDPDLETRDTGGSGLRVPLFHPNKPGKRVDMTIPVQEGDQYRLGQMNFTGVKFFRKPEVLMRPMFQMQEGDIFNVSKIRKGLENLHKLYGEFGFISMVPDARTDIDEPHKRINMTFEITEDKQFFVRRIEFSGNTTTRDKVIRRELLLDEGDMYNSRLWEVSILRLNQLGFFEPIKPEQATQEAVKPDNRTGQVDINLKVKEKGKNTIGLTGGVSGIAGSFIGLNYQTNNFLGLGETLTFEVQLGNRERDVLFGFTEPYLFDRPLQAGFTVFARRFNFDQAREASILSGQNLIPFFAAVGNDNLQNFRQSSRGFTVFSSYPLRRSFSRVGLTYSFDKSSLTVFSAASRQFFEFLNFRGVSGPNSLEGITTSKVIPTYIYNTVDSPLNPHSGRSLFVGMEFSGVGGNVNLVRPTFEFKMFKPLQKKRNVLGFRVLGSFISGYGGKVAPPFERFYIGGETDIRGFDIRAVSPIAFVPDDTTVNVLGSDGLPRTTTVVVNGVTTTVPLTLRIPISRIIFPGGDTQSIGNFEYRVPIAGPVTLAAFFDAGLNFVWRRSQLSVTPQRLQELSSLFPGAPFDSRIKLAPGTNRQLRTSTGLELQVLLPIVNAPFRLYWAYNLNRVQTTLTPDLLVDRSFFPNDLTYQQTLQFGRPIPLREPLKTFRFTISRTF